MFPLCHLHRDSHIFTFKQVAFQLSARCLVFEITFQNNYSLDENDIGTAADLVDNYDVQISDEKQVRESVKQKGYNFRIFEGDYKTPIMRHV